MFANLSQSFQKIFDNLKSRGSITESHIDESMKSIKNTLIDADVALPVIKDFVEKIKIKAKGQKVIQSISPAQMIIKIVHDEIIDLISDNDQESRLLLNNTKPNNILISGLQGSGKTTACAKVALRLKKQGKKVLLVSLDTYRPSAQDQLEILARSIDVDSLEILSHENPLEITHRALRYCSELGYDVVIYDTAGRLHIDQDMIQELQMIKDLIKPVENLLVVDAMIGQDAIHVVQEFNKVLDITGLIVSRIDGDARGGVALSARYITHKPIKFLSNGESVEDFEELDAKRVASRILGMGDIVSLVEKASDIIDKKDQDALVSKMQKGKFDFDDYRSQIKMIKKLGGMGSVLNMMPGFSKLTNKINTSMIDDKVFMQQEAIILSMTKKERKNPSILNASRKNRIVLGSGVPIQSVNVLLKQFKHMSVLMKKTAKMKGSSLAKGMMDKFFS